MTGLLYLFFFCSGLSGLIYQVVWVRVFGNVFGNTIYSASLVIAVFMLGLGAGSYLVGAWADRRYEARPDSLLRAYGYVELAIALMGCGISLLLPHLGQVSALVSSYSREPNGWYALSTSSYLARIGIAIMLLAPITLLMGGTLTLLIRHLVGRDLELGAWQIAVLYGVNTAGAALGCLLTDFALVPVGGLRAAQMVAVGLNVFAGAGALWLQNVRGFRLQADGSRGMRLKPEATHGLKPEATYVTALALALSGFAAMGMEILWFRHFTILLGGFRAVFSLLLTVILVGIGAGSLLSALVHRRLSRAAESLMIVQGFFVASALLGLAAADARRIEETVTADPGYQVFTGRLVQGALGAESGLTRTFTELWFNARPILLEVAVPALLLGFSFPLANRIIQRAERSVGRRAGVLYLSNTAGAVCGSLAAGFLFLPSFGIQASATILMMAATLAIVPLYLATWAKPRAAIGPSALACGALALWLMLPSDYIITRALARAPDKGGHVLAMREGVSEVVAVIDVPGKGRALLTNGHPMSSTTRLAQRYMRALAHIPLLSIEHPETVLVIGFGVGNTTHAATLHPSIRRVEVADLSRDILAHTGYFADVNHGVLNDRRVVVYVNDGRHHVHMQPPASYDLITLEPPPIGYAGVAALYSKEFYEVARTQLKPGGYMSQWLPAYQVPTSTTLAMIRAFVDVFPQAVLLSGAEADLLLVGANLSRIAVDPDALTAALSSRPGVQADLRRLDLGSVREIVGTFVGSPQKLAEATSASPAVSDDRPIQEYGVRSLLNFGEAVPRPVVDLAQVAAWCPTCFVDGKPVASVDGLDMYLSLLGRAYSASPVEVSRARDLADRQGRKVAGSAYLGAMVPESADLHNTLGIALAEKGKLDGAIAEFREALGLEPDSAQTHWHLGAALLARGAREEAVEHLRRSVQLDPRNASAHDDLGVALGSLGKLDEAADEFQRALAVDPDFAEARRHLQIARQHRGR